MLTYLFRSCSPKLMVDIHICNQSRWKHIGLRFDRGLKSMVNEIHILNQWILASKHMLHHLVRLASIVRYSSMGYSFDMDLFIFDFQ